MILTSPIRLNEPNETGATNRQDVDFVELEVPIYCESESRKNEGKPVEFLHDFCTDSSQINP
jgi:hypothetical protein